jgi:hypothetical protein
MSKSKSRTLLDHYVIELRFDRDAFLAQLGEPVVDPLSEWGNTDAFPLSPTIINVNVRSVTGYELVDVLLVNGGCVVF